MPMTGYTIHIDPRRVIPLPISVDDTLRVVVSGGVLVPPAELVGELPEPLVGELAEPLVGAPRPAPGGLPSVGDARPKRSADHEDGAEKEAS